MTWTEIFVTFFIGSGTAFCFLGALGLLRMPDFYSRMQAITKGTTLGVGLHRAEARMPGVRAFRESRRLANRAPQLRHGRLSPAR